MAANLSVKELIDQAQLSTAIERAGATLRDRPGDVALRRLLITLLGYSGDLNRAGKQLDAVVQQAMTDPSALAWATVDRALIEAESARARLYKDGLRPKFVGSIPDHIAKHLDALDAIREGRIADARTLLDAAEPPKSAGTYRQEAFDEIRDADDILRPVLEVFAPAGYFWLPWEQVQYLEIQAPETLRDLLWTPARLATFDGQIGEVHLPSLYPTSSTSSDDQIRLGRATDWQDLGENLVRGVGRKILLIGDHDSTLVELGSVSLNRPEAPAAAPSDAITPE